MSWSLEELAHRSGLSARYLSSVENDKSDPSLSTLSAIGRALGVDPGELLGTRDLSPAAMEAGRAFASLSRDAQRTVLDLMRLLNRRTGRRAT
ncbi:MAG: helix-turn-helix transcriptional regulator [Labilithrix sp.]|nr:helix-turn-helix transcriptional regulator [Labilithrix sp.]MCW5817386.1 helix-turn-helix transcriptional regulator [Labilithrix sp.]